jgi:hypothetical protein
MSEDGFSCGASETSETTTGGAQRRQNNARTITSYLLAHPPPSTRQKKMLHMRPKLLFQLQKTTGEKRPVPVIDAFVSTTIAPRLAKKFPRVFKGKGELGINDVMLLRSEDYDAPDSTSPEDSDDDSLSDREVLAVICQLKGSSETEICLSDGSIWRASALPKGTFQFVTEDPVTRETTVARWVQKLGSRRHSDIPASSAFGNSLSTEAKYTFSVLNSGLRRHPIMASLSASFLDIPDQYTSVSPSNNEQYPSSPSNLSPGPAPTAEESPQPTKITVDDQLRLVIQVTGIWVALRQGWCRHFKYPDDVNGSIHCPANLTGSGRSRSNSLNLDGGHRVIKSDARAITPEPTQSSLHALRQAFKSPSTSPAQAERIGMPKRTVSTGTMFMQRQRAARLLGHPPSTVASDTETDSLPSPLPRSVAFDGDGSHSMASFQLASDGPLSSTSNTPTKPTQARLQPAPQPSATPSYKRQSGAPPPGSSEGTRAARNSPEEHQPRLEKDRKRQKGSRWKNFIRLFKRGDQRKGS